MRAGTSDCSSLLAAFIDLEVFQHGLNIIPLRKIAFFFAFYEDFGGFIIPSPLPDEFIPNLNVTSIEFPTIRKTPLQNFLVGTSLQYTVLKPVVFDSKKLGTPCIEPFSEIFMKIGA
jgi:hypothetical protein